MGSPRSEHRQLSSLALYRVFRFFLERIELADDRIVIRKPFGYI